MNIPGTHKYLSYCLSSVTSHCVTIRWLIMLAVKAFKLLLPLYSCTHCYFWIKPTVKSLSKVTPLELLFVR